MTTTTHVRSAPRWLIVSFIVAVGAAVLAGIAAVVAIAAPAVDDTTSATAARIAPSAAPMVAPVTTDAQVCGDLARVGSGFYLGPYMAAMTSGRGARTTVNVQPIELAAQLGALTTVGAPAGQIDGSQAISQASPDVASSMITMTRDADRLAQASANTATSGVQLINDLTPIVNSFTTALISCTKAGYQPAYFNPQALLGH